MKKNSSARARAGLATLLISAVLLAAQVVFATTAGASGFLNG